MPEKDQTAIPKTIGVSMILGRQPMSNIFHVTNVKYMGNTRQVYDVTHVSYIDVTHVKLLDIPDVKLLDILYRGVTN